MKSMFGDSIALFCTSDLPEGQSNKTPIESVEIDNLTKSVTADGETTETSQFRLTVTQKNGEKVIYTTVPVVTVTHTPST